MFACARYFISDEDPLVAKAIGVFLVDSRREPIYPIIVFASMHGSVDEVEEEINPAGVLWDAWTKGISDQTIGIEHQFTNVRKVKQGKIMAIPMEEIEDYAALEEKVINAVLAMDLK